MRHIFDFITQPKMPARDNTRCLAGRLKNYGNYVEMKHYEFYDEVLYQKKSCKNSNEEIQFISEEIKKHFKKLNSPSEEKIEILQKWRSAMKTEINAYEDEADFIHKIFSLNTQLEKVEGEFLFDSKVKLVEEMLKNEIALVRKISAEKYGH